MLSLVDRNLKMVIGDLLRFKALSRRQLWFELQSHNNKKSLRKYSLLNCGVLHWLCQM